MNLGPTPRIASPGDLLALVPTVLGFHPEDSLVLVVTSGEVGALHARVDLPDDEEGVALVVQHLLHAVTRAQARQVALVAYSDDWLATEDLVDALVEQLHARDVEVLCAVRADGERWYPLGWLADDELDDGVPYDVFAHPITAQAVLDGRVVFGSRSDLADSLVGGDPEAVESVARAAEEALRRSMTASRPPLGMPSPDGARAHLMTEGYWVRERVRRWVRTGEPLDHDEVGRLVVATASIDVRDVAWAEITRSDAGAHVELWRDVVRRTPRDLLAAPAALLAFAAWLAGDGALAWCAVERCQEAEPDYSMAALVSQALVAALPPSTWQPIPPGGPPALRGVTRFLRRDGPWL
jgi:hypothetical protein